MNTKLIRKFSVLAFVPVLSLLSGCSTYGGGGYGGGTFGVPSGLSTTVGRYLDPKIQRSLRASERRARQEERQAYARQRLEERRLEVARLQAERQAANERRIAEEKRRWEQMTPAERQAAIEAQKKRDEFIAEKILPILAAPLIGGAGGDNATGSGQYDSAIDQARRNQMRIDRQTQETNRMNPQGTGAYGSAW